MAREEKKLYTERGEENAMDLVVCRAQHGIETAKQFGTVPALNHAMPQV